MRAFDSPCGADNASIPFLEFRWAHFFARAHEQRRLWPKPELAAAFATAYAALPPTCLGREQQQQSQLEVNTSAWYVAAAKLVPLARSAAAAEYELPAEFGAHAGRLPGFHSGLGGIPSDEPECGMIGCTDP